MMDETDELSEQQKALARQWGKRLEDALKKQREDKQEKRFKELRAYVRGDVGDDGEKGLVRTNIIHSNFAAIIPQIYAKNPEIAVTPTEAAGDTVKWVPQFCKTLQAVLNRKFVKEGRLKKRTKSAIRSAMTTSIGWAKVSWQKDIRTDPLIENRIADTQDNLQRVRMLIDEIQEGDDSRAELEAKQGELEQQLSALQQQAEVSVVEGIVIDRVLTEDIFVLDDTIYDFDQYDQADTIAHRVWMRCEQYKQTFGKDAPKTANRYGSDKKEFGKSIDQDEDKLLVAVFECWNRTSNTVYTLCAGADEWAREPYVPQHIGQRFYPFFALAFNPVDGRVNPISDAELLKELQDEYSTTRTNFAEHRAENLPVRVYRKSSDLTDNDVKALANRSPNQWVGIEGNPDTPIEKDIAVLPNPPIDPAVYDVAPILRDAELVLGAGDASKGVVNKAKTATEAEIMAQGLQSRVAERQDVVEDWISDMAQFAAEILLQEMTLPQVQRIAGAESVWPQMNKEQIFDLVQIEIRAGSSGRPNKAKEREQWGQMLPQIQESMSQIMQLRQAGQNDMAEMMLKLMEETLRRFDERIDIESFMPQQEAGGQKPTIPPELQQQVQQMQQAMQQMQEENAQLKQVADGKAQDIAFSREKLAFEQSKAGEEIRLKSEDSARNEAALIRTAEIKAQAQVVAAEKTAEINAGLERERIASQERVEMAKAMMTACQAQHQQRQDEAQAVQQAQVSDVANQQVVQMIEQLQKAMQAMAANFSQSLSVMQESLTAPKRVIRDDNGDIAGVEVVRTLQ
jgi:hypothetical protein